MRGQDLAFFTGSHPQFLLLHGCSASSSAHSQVTHPPGRGLAAQCKLALAKLWVLEGMLGFEYGRLFQVNEAIQISFILVSDVWNFLILELIKFTKKLTTDIKENLQ